MSDTQADFMGKNGFIWWTGVVEDVNDPLRIGRLRVRIVGFHTEDKTLLPTNTLPWATVLQPITSAATSGVGTSPTGVVQGSWVMGFFRDGWSAQDPVVMGTFAGIPEQLPNKNEGFSDPDEKYPTLEYLGESDVSRLARGQSTVYTIVDDKRQTRVQGVRTALGGSWSEPGTPYRAVYPMNSVTQSRAGHVIEIDDTSFAPRVHIYHNSGSFLEMHPNGTVVDKVVGNDFEIDLKNKKVIVKGNMSETVDGNKRELVGGGYTIEVLGNLTTLVHGDHFVQTKGNYYHKVDGSFTLVAGDNGIILAKRIDVNPPELTIDSFPDVVELKDVPSSTSTTETTRGNEREANVRPNNLSQVQKFDTQVAVLEKQKSKKRKEKSSAAAAASAAQTNNAIPSPTSVASGGAISKVNAASANGVQVSSPSANQPSSYLLPSKKKDCKLYCDEVIRNTGGSEQDYAYCLQECEAYNRQIDGESPNEIGKDADCSTLDGLGIGGVLSPIQQAVSEVGEAITGTVTAVTEGIEGAIEDVGEAIFGTPQEQYCKERVNSICDSAYQRHLRFGSCWGTNLSRDEFMKKCKEDKGDNGNTIYEDCLQWCKDNPEEFAEVNRERKSESPVAALSKGLSNVGSLLNGNSSIPGLPSIPCVGIGVIAGVGAGIAISEAVGGGGGVIAGVAGGVVTASVVTAAISPTTKTIEPPPPAPPDNVADAGTF